MKNSVFRNIVTALLMTTLLTGCNGCFRKDITNEIPEPITERVNIDLPESSINIPVSIELQKLEDLINHKISGKFLELTIYPLQSESDQALLSFTKVKPIDIKISGDQLSCKVTLQVDAKLVKSRYGEFLTKQVKPMETEVAIDLVTPVTLGSDWSLVTKLKLKSLRWIKDPVLRIGPYKKNLKVQLAEALHKNESKLTGLLSNELSKSVSLQPVVGKIWNDLQKPINIHRKTPQAWMKFTCDSIAGKLEIEKDLIRCYTNVRAKMMLLTDTNGLPQPKPLPAFSPLEKIAEQSDIYLYAFTSFEEINTHLNNLFHGKTFSAKGYTIAVDSVKAYASVEGLSVQVKTTGEIAGTVVASGKLQFNPNSKKIVIRNFDYAMSTNSTLLNAGDQLLHSYVQDTIASKLILGLDTLIERLPQIIENAIAKGKPGNTIDLNLDTLVVKDCKITMGPKRMHFEIHAGAGANIQIKQIRGGKKLDIKVKPKR